MAEATARGDRVVLTLTRTEALMLETVLDGPLQGQDGALFSEVLYTISTALQQCLAIPRTQ